MLKKIFANYKNLKSSEYVAQHPNKLLQHIIVHVLSELVSFTIFCLVMVCIYYVVLSFFPQFFAGGML